MVRAGDLRVEVLAALVGAVRLLVPDGDAVHLPQLPEHCGLLIVDESGRLLVGPGINADGLLPILRLLGSRTILDGLQDDLLLLGEDVAPRSFGRDEQTAY